MKRRSVMRKLLALMLALVMCAGPVLSAGGGIVAEAAQTAQYRNVVYYGEWSIYAGQKYFYPSYIDGSYITHLNFAFLDVDANGNLVLCDEHADFQTILPEQNGITYGEPYAGVLGAMCILREKYPNMKIGISVGGWTRSGDFPAMAANPTTRQNFARNIAKFVDYLGYDFVDIDWEYPTAQRAPDPAGNGVTIDKGCMGSEADTRNFTLLMQAIRDELDALGEQNGKYYELSCAMSANPSMMAKIEYDKVLEIVDFANMMTYDLNGAWASFTAHQTALYTNPAFDPVTQADGAFSVDTCVRYLEDTYGDSIDYTKIVIGVAPYTRGWAGVENDGRDPQNPGLYATAEPNSVKAADGVMSGTFSQSDIPMLVSQYGLTEYYDEVAEACYYYSADTGYFFTCDNARSIAAKGAYVREKGLGGLISWMASLDASNDLTRTMKESLYGSAALPAQEIIVAQPNVSLSISVSGTSTYSFTLTNNETVNESNTALKDAELFKETVTFPKLYIQSASGATFSAGSEAGSVTNQNGYGVIDLASVYAAKALKPGASHTFTVNVSGEANLADIVGVTMTQRILTSLSESAPQVVYGAGSDEDIPVVTTPPATNPPATNPPATNPPATNPPATNPPATEPPATNPPATEPPVSGIPAWNSSTAYTGGNQVVYNGNIYQAKWWTQGDTPGATAWGPWELIGSAGNPPATEPPVTEPPVTEPPVTEPPVTEPPVTEPPATEPPATGSYPEWTSGTTYKVGDLVVYQGKVYECTYAHTCHMGWLPDQTPTLWKLRSDLVAGEPVVTEPPATEPPATNPPATEPPATEPPVTEPPVSGIPAWSSSATYTGGDQVTYNGNIYQAKWWTRGDTPGAAAWGPWELIGSAGNPPATEPPATEPPATEPPATEPPATEPPATEPPVTEPPVTEPPATEPPATQPPVNPGNRALPDHLVVGYWHNFVNGSTNLKLSDIPDCYDMICVAFTGNSSTAGEATFELDPDLCAAVGGYTKAEFIQDIKDLQAKGKFVIISVGGAEGRISITSDAAANTFTNSMKGIIEEYGFDGIDIDLEGGAVAGTAYIARSLRDLHNYFGDDFIITMAPETAYVQNAQGSYLKLALEIKDILTICFPQFYNSGTMIGYDGMAVSPGTADFITSQLTTIVESGLRPDQVGIGLPCVPSAAGSGYISNDVIEQAVVAFVTGTKANKFVAPSAYPGLRCMMTWSINWDATNNYAWGNAMSDLMDRVDTMEPPEPSEEITGATTWDANKVYVGGDTVMYNGSTYQAKWWTQGDVPGSGTASPWTRIG